MDDSAFLASSLWYTHIHNVHKLLLPILQGHIDIIDWCMPVGIVNQITSLIKVSICISAYGSGLRSHLLLINFHLSWRSISLWSQSPIGGITSQFYRSEGVLTRAKSIRVVVPLVFTRVASLTIWVTERVCIRLDSSGYKKIWRWYPPRVDNLSNQRNLHRSPSLLQFTGTIHE